MIDRTVDLPDGHRDALPAARPEERSDIGELTAHVEHGDSAKNLYSRQPTLPLTVRGVGGVTAYTRGGFLLCRSR